MATSQQLPPAAWMTTPERRRLFAALGAPDVDVRYVGGCVRNWLMSQSVGEVDVATPDVPERVMERLAATGLKAIPTGLSHGTVTAVIGAETVEITTLRHDTACDGRHAAVEFSTDWHEDARRRDFTINAMSLRLDGTLFDDHGGLDDARAGRLRFVGAAADRIQEDYLRILRLFRFFAWYGRVPIDADTLAAVRHHRAGLARLSAERIAQELGKLLAAPDPTAALGLMHDTGVFAEVLPGASTSAVARLIACEKDSHTAPDWLRRLAVLLPDDMAETTAERLKFSNADAARLKVLTDPTPPTTAAHLDRALYRLGAPAVIDRILRAAARKDDGATDWRALIGRARAWTDKQLPIRGADVLALGVAPGPAVGALLSGIEAWWIDTGFSATRAQALAELKRRVEKR